MGGSICSFPISVAPFVFRVFCGFRGPPDGRFWFLTTDLGAALVSGAVGCQTAAPAINQSETRRVSLAARAGKKGGKKKPPANRNSGGRAVIERRLFLLFLARGGLGDGGLGGLRLGHALLELVHAAGGIDELLLARVERMAGVANTDRQILTRRTGLDRVAAGATDFRLVVFRMSVSFHNKGAGPYQSAAG